MKTAIASWRGRVAPVFDSAKKLELFIEGEDGVAVREEILLPEGPFYLRVNRLEEEGVDRLICGAVSSPLAEAITSRGIELFAFIAGEVEEVLAASRRKGFPEDRFLQPGCCCGQGRKQRRGIHGNVQGTCTRRRRGREM